MNDSPEAEPGDDTAKHAATVPPAVTTNPEPMSTAPVVSAASTPDSSLSPAPAPAPSAQKNRTPEQGSGGAYRRGLALFVILVTLSGFIYLRAGDHWRSCASTTTTNTRDVTLTTKTESCGELPLTTLVPVLILVLALMWPDIAEVELFGLGSVKRRLNEQDSRQNELEMTQLRLANQLDAYITQTANLQQDASNVMNLNLWSDPERAMQLVEMKRAREEAETVSEAPPTTPPATVANEAQELQGRLDALRPTLAPWLNAARRMTDPLFADAVEKGAPSGRAAEDPRLRADDAEVLSRIMVPGTPFDLAAFTSWYEENSAQINALRRAYSRVDQTWLMNSLRIAAKFADQMVSDLQRRRLIS